MDIDLKLRQNRETKLTDSGLMKKILVLHGPNLNHLGLREPKTYGTETLDEINQTLKQQALQALCTLTAKQSNSEADLIEFIHQAYSERYDFIIINPAAFTHTSIALRDALLTVNIPFIEVHISNVFSREPFRQHSFFSDVARGVITGFGPYGYVLALQAVVEYFKSRES